MVLATQTRLVWQIAQLYQQRPHWRELLNLYSNVAVTALLVSEIEDLDISEQIEPIVASVLGSGVVGAVPGLGTVAVNILTNSLIEGTANAFLTLRIGSVTRQYCGALTRLDKRLVRRSATVATAALLGAIVRESAGVVSKAILKAASDVGTRGAAKLMPSHTNVSVATPSRPEPKMTMPPPGLGAATSMKLSYASSPPTLSQ